MGTCLESVVQRFPLSLEGGDVLAALLISHGAVGGPNAKSKFWSKKNLRRILMKNQYFVENFRV